MRRRHIPPVDDVTRTLRRTALLAASAGVLAATVGCQSAAGLAARTRGRVGRVLESVAQPLSALRSESEPRVATEEPTGPAIYERTSADGPTSRDQLIEYGLVPRTYVYGVLRDHGGRMKQRRFVDEYGWSASTVSRLLSDLENEGAIERYRIGREKVVCLPGYGRGTE